MKLPYRSKCQASAALLLLSAVCLAIAAAPVIAQADAVVEELKLNQRKWAAQQIKDYQFTFRRICFCLPVYVIITVRDGKVETVRYADREQLPVEPDQFSRYPTVDELFALIQKAVDKKAYQINASYDPELGFPTAVFIDYDRRIADEELGFTVTDLKVDE